MNRRAIAALAFIWVVSLVSVAVWAQGNQATLQRAPLTVEGNPVGEVITAENIGFQRVASQPSGPNKVVGKWMVRVNGVWVEAESPIRIVR